MTLGQVRGDLSLWDHSSEDLGGLGRPPLPHASHKAHLRRASTEGSGAKRREEERRTLGRRLSPCLQPCLKPIRSPAFPSCGPVNPYTFHSSHLCSIPCSKTFCLRQAAIKGHNQTPEGKPGPEPRSREAAELSCQECWAVSRW